MTRLFPKVFSIVINLVVGEHSQVLILKRSIAMVFKLAINICQHRIHFGSAYCKRHRIRLAMEFKARVFLLIDVFARTRFQLPYKIGYRNLGWNPKE